MRRMPMDAQRIYRTYRRYALELAARYDVPIEDSLLALARAASECNPNLADFKIAQYVRAQTEESIARAKSARAGFGEAG